MRTTALIVGLLTSVLLGYSSFAATLTTSTVDGGGQRSSSADYTMDCSIGGIGSVSTSSAVTLNDGYIGQLTEVTNLTLVSDANPVNEGSICHLSGMAGLDDGTVSLIEGSNVTWGVPALPIILLDTNGQATITTVYANVSVVVTGCYMGVTALGMVMVQDGNPDNYGNYAGDGIPDCWQVMYFGTNNLVGIASATNVTGQSNWKTYLADLNPTNAASVLKVVAVTNQAMSRFVYFTPSSTGRVYALWYSTNLVSGIWTNLTPVTNWGNGGTCWLTDTNLSSRYYRIAVQLP